MAENDLLKRLLDAGMTFTALTQARAEELIRDLVRVGAVQAEQAQASVDELVDRSRRNSEKLVDAVRTEIDDQLGRLDLATRDDLERMVQRFTDVASGLFGQAKPARTESSSDAPDGPRAATPAVESAPVTAAKSPARTAKKTTTAASKTNAAKKAGTKKATSKKSAARKAPAKSSAARKKSAAKKAPAKKSAAKKSAAKSSAAKKKSATKKAPAKRSTSPASGGTAPTPGTGTTAAGRPAPPSGT